MELTHVQDVDRTWATDDNNPNMHTRDTTKTGNCEEKIPMSGHESAIAYIGSIVAVCGGAVSNLNLDDWSRIVGMIVGIGGLILGWRNYQLNKRKAGG